MERHYYAAAGGIVLRGGNVLLLHKHLQDEYVLPKGHVEAGESLEAAALREVLEETGYARLRPLASLGTLRGEFPLNGRWVVRDETYFLMALLDDTRVDVPGHADAEYDQNTFHQLWVPLAGAAERLSFEPARTFMRRAAAWVQAHPEATAG
jgi:8-oxo-dGTP pyrophosphatase MutT (NUDIX family)